MLKEKELSEASGFYEKREKIFFKRTRLKINIFL